MVNSTWFNGEIPCGEFLQATGISIEKLAYDNNIQNIDLIFTGDVLILKRDGDVPAGYHVTGNGYRCAHSKIVINNYYGDNRVIINNSTFVSDDHSKNTVIYAPDNSDNSVSFSNNTTNNNNDKDKDTKDSKDGKDSSSSSSESKDASSSSTSGSYFLHQAQQQKAVVKAKQVQKVLKEKLTDDAFQMSSRRILKYLSTKSFRWSSMDFLLTCRW